MAGNMSFVRVDLPPENGTQLNVEKSRGKIRKRNDENATENIYSAEEIVGILSGYRNLNGKGKSKPTAAGIKESARPSITAGRKNTEVCTRIRRNV
jgi:hypothetical protein